MKRCGRRILFATGIVAAVVTGMILNVQLAYRDRIKPITNHFPTSSVAIVLGASVTDQGEPSDALADRLTTGARLYTEGTVKKILITGDDGAFRRDEITAMHRFLVQASIPSEDILIDGHGYRTYESCKNAVTKFNIHQAILVTQAFHLPRALYLCEHLGMDAWGVQADMHSYQRIQYFEARDLLASIKAWWDIHVIAPAPPAS